MTGLFGSLFGSLPDDAAWLRAMLDVEAALATAGERAGIVPQHAAAEIVRACRVLEVDVDALGRDAVSAGNPVVPLVRLLTAAVDERAAPYVHLGATSQDVVDTALMLLAQRTRTVVTDDLTAVGAALAALADQHRGTLMPARTLLQQALPTTFGLVCASWLTSVDEARQALDGVELAVQYGGAAGTLAALGGDGVQVMGQLAAVLGLAEPALPWHTNRSRIVALASAVGTVLGALGKLGHDVVLLAQTEVGEVTAGHGESSTMPHKNNPVDAVLLTACAAQAPALVASLFAAMDQEHQRPAGAWHAEWQPVTTLLRLTGAASAHARTLLDNLQVDAQRMRANLDATHGAILAESVAVHLAAKLGRGAARDVVRAAVQRAGAGSLRAALLDDPRVTEHLDAAAIDAALDPAGYLGSADAFVDRALAAHHRFEEHT